MRYIKRDLGSYKLHMIKTNKFKTVKIKISFRNKIIKDEITIRNVLSDVLTYSSNKYKTRRDISIKTQDLYAATLQNYTTRIGNYFVSDFTLTVLNDKYTEVGNLCESIKFLKDIIYDANVENDAFDEDTLSIIKSDTKTSLNSIKEDPVYYSLIRTYELMNKDMPSSYRMCGYLEDLDKINSKNLYTKKKKMINKDLMDIFIVGDIDFKEIENIIKELFPLKTFKKLRATHKIEPVKPRGRKLRVNEESDNSQSKLIMGCRIYKLNSYEYLYPLTLYNIILGGGADSKLFQEVREKNSLCYTISSVPNKLDHILLIRAGVDKNNVKKTVELTETQMNLMRKGKFSDEDIKKAKEFYQTSLEEMLESQASIISYYYMMDLLGLDDIKTRIKTMKKVEKSEIVKVAKKIKIDTIFCLEGVKE